MDNFINRLMDKPLRLIMDKSRHKLALSDKIYKKDLKDSLLLEKSYNALPLGRNERILIDDYIACLLTREERMNELSYMIGVRDTIQFLNEIGLLKGSKQNFKKRLKISKMLKKMCNVGAVIRTSIKGGKMKDA